MTTPPNNSPSSDGSPLVCIIAGDRDADYSHSTDIIDSCPFKHRITHVVSGKAKGADTNGEYWAYHNNIPVISKPADWNTHGKAAGPIRNGEMAQIADAAIIIPKPDGTYGVGSMDMVKKMVAKLGRKQAMQLIWPPPPAIHTMF